MNRLDNRLTRLELASPNSKRLVVIHMDPHEEEAAALARHLAEHPEDRDAGFTVFISRFAGEDAA